MSSSQALIDKQLERKKDYSNFYDNLLDGGGGWGGDLLMEGRRGGLSLIYPQPNIPMCEL